VLRSGERPASHQCNGEYAKPYSDLQNRKHSPRAHQSSDKTYQSTDVSDEIPEFLTSLRTSTIYTLEKVGKETVATIVASPAISEHEFCKPALTAQSARHRADTGKYRSAFAIGRKRREIFFAGGTDGGSGCRELWSR
jgi:hypothetical protein